MTWWQWGLAVLVAAAGIALGGFHLGVTTQRKDDADARVRLAVQVDSARTAHAADTARLADDVARATLRATLAENRAVEAEAAAQHVADEVLVAQDALRASQTTADSLSAYPPLVDALTRERDSLKASREGYKAALAASKEKSALLLSRIAVDGVLSAAKDVMLGSVTPPPPPSKSGWGCVAGVTVATGLRTGAGLGVTCGRKL